ncbi:hypothetical protein LEP1GSC036_0327 [Leptospira weilii str. 2006001853]|uniref:Uncharacterized protein n=2 Tax=Leptospira weilii TaxID=28184 RepID=A0A828Z5L7_9LEPT|nr:hypothetical protein LEP1GSC036_0327 [Leptospira weilii str. 2006001853]EMM73614.1 hypothetical protein LEP1GSC038_2697 [Leptospira weilii str. 2006001855]OMI18594.1 hypothetical protein BUQ74_04270 [Leptospira weilii serovar Heyan]QDK21956.1 hypothetical protein FHG67_03775 [Leptospira weilii]QDK25895.1 hypothetical protein FHG68_03630 [Leptospira weilii]
MKIGHRDKSTSKKETSRRKFPIKNFNLKCGLYLQFRKVMTTTASDPIEWLKNESPIRFCFIKTVD